MQSFKLIAGIALLAGQVLYGQTSLDTLLAQVQDPSPGVREAAFTIGHHLKVLEESGLAQVVARRLVRGIVASYYTRTARIFSFELPEDVEGGISASLDIMDTARNELAEALATIKDDPVRKEGFPHIRLSPERARYYAERLDALIEDLVHEQSDPDGKVYGILMAMFMSPPYMQGPDPLSTNDAV
jgi:DNA-binding transcriptional ArsR family regulator